VVSIGFAWRRVAGADIAGLAGEDLRALAPHGPAEEYFRLQEAGLIAGTEYDGVVIGALLGLGDGKSPGAEAFVDMPGDWDDDYLIGTLGPDTVADIAATMAAAQWRAWLTEHFDGLLAGAEEAGYEDAIVDAAPDGQWADHLLRCAAELTALFTAAAAAGQSIVFSMSA
jgi:hypothetical protein